MVTKEMEKVDARRLLNISDENYSRLLCLLNLNKITLKYLADEGETLALFFNSVGGDLLPLEVGQYALSPIPVAGLTLNHNHDYVQFSLDQQVRMEQRVRKLFNKENLVVPFYTPALLDKIIEFLTIQTVKKALNIDDIVFENFLRILKEEHLSFYFDRIQDNSFAVLIRHEKRGFTAMPGILEECGGFVFSIDSDGSPAITPEGVLQVANQQYQDHTGNNNLFLHDSLLEDQIADFVDEYFSQCPETTNAEVKAEKEHLLHDVCIFLQPYLEKEELELVDAKAKVHPGLEEELARKSLKNTPEFPIVDLLIVAKGSSAIEIRPQTFYGWKKPPGHKKKELSELTPYDNVYGVVLVENDTPVEERKRLLRLGSKQLERRYPGHVGVVLLTLDRNLLNKWQETQQPLVPSAVADEARRSASTKKAVDYGFSINKNEAPRVYLHTYEPLVPHVGGTQIAMQIEYDKTLSRVLLLDRGWMYDVMPSWSSLGSAPAYADGISPFLRAGMFDMIRRLYDISHIKNSISDSVLRTVLNLQNSSTERAGFYSLEEFLLMEVFHRLGEEDFFAFLKNKNPILTQELLRRNHYKQLLAYLEQREKILYAQKSIFDIALLTHAHADHTGAMAFLNRVIPVGESVVTRGLLLAEASLGSSWISQDAAAIALREEPKIGNAYQRLERPYRSFKDGERIEVAPGVFVTGISVEHSIPGAMGFVIDVEHHGKLVARVAYPGDQRDYRIFPEIGKMGGTDFLFVEGTNPPSANKDSKFVTELEVRNRLAGDIAEANDRRETVVIDLPKNSFEPLENILAIANPLHRSVVLSAKIAQRIQLVQMAQRENVLLPEVQPNNPNILIWKPNKTTYSLEEREMFATYGVCDPDTLSRNPENYILVRENESPVKLEGVGPKVLWIDASYGAYSEAARKEKEDRKYWAKQHNWRFIDRGRRASGHMPIRRADDPEASESALAHLREARAGTICVVHSEHPGEVASVLKSNNRTGYPGYVDSTTKVIERRSHPRDKFRVEHRDNIRNNGHR
jgi:hypothetical protein